MVSWDLKIKFKGLSPHIKELEKLAKQERFSNIENMEYIESDKNCRSTYLLVVNDRGTEQTEFKYEKVE